MQNQSLSNISNAEESLNIPYDKFCDLLGGLSLTHLPDHHKRKYADLLKKETFLKLNQILSQKNQYHYLNEPSGLFPVEVLYLKLSAFLQLVNEVKNFSLSHHKTHLRVQPQNIHVTIKKSNGTLPLRWGFSVKLAGEPPLFPDNIDNPLIKRNLFEPKTPPDKFYSSPAMLNTPFMCEKRIDSVISSVREVENNNGILSLRLQMDFFSDSVGYPRYVRNDVLHVRLSCNDPDLERIDFWGTMLESSNKGFKITGDLQNIEERAAKVLVKRKGNKFFETLISLYKSYHIPCDIYSLGKLLLSSLLLNEKNDLQIIETHINSIVSTLNKSYQGKKTDLATIEKLLFPRFNKNAEIFAKNNVLFYTFTTADQQGNQCNKIPRDIWEQILTLAFRLITNIHGFSLCPVPGNYDINKPVPYDQLISLLEDIQSMLFVELFRTEQQNDEVYAVLNEVLKDI